MRKSRMSRLFSAWSLLLTSAVFGLLPGDVVHDGLPVSDPVAITWYRSDVTPESVYYGQITQVNASYDQNLPQPPVSSGISLLPEFVHSDNLFFLTTALYAPVYARGVLI